MNKNHSKILAIIPARSGSKGVANKNIFKINEKPLISWTINSALNSNIIKKVIVSTDSKEIANIANLSINETLARTIITSVTTLLALFSIFILGGEILRGFSFAMILGVFIGTYSSIFVASPILKFFKVSYKTLEKEEEKIVP